MGGGGGRRPETENQAKGKKDKHSRLTEIKIERRRDPKTDCQRDMKG